MTISRSNAKKIVQRRVIVEPANPDGKPFETVTRSNIMPGPDEAMIWVVGIASWVPLKRVKFLEETERK